MLARSIGPLDPAETNMIFRQMPELYCPTSSPPAWRVYCSLRVVIGSSFTRGRFGKSISANVGGST